MPSGYPPYSGYSGGGGSGGPILVPGVVFLVTPADTPYTVGASDGAIFMDATGGNGIVNLPAATDRREITVKNSAAAAVLNTVAVTPNGAETIDSVAGARLYTGTQGVTLVGRAGVGWYIT